MIPQSSGHTGRKAFLYNGKKVFVPWIYKMQSEQDLANEQQQI